LPLADCSGDSVTRDTLLPISPLGAAASRRPVRVGSTIVTCRLLLAVLALAGCADATTSASGVRLADPIFLEAVIDGRSWVADSGTRRLLVSPRADRIQFQGSRRGRGDTVQTLSVAVGRFAFNTPISILLGENGSNAIFATFAPPGNPILFFADSSDAGSVTLDGLDPINQLASGRFEFRARLVLFSPEGSRLGDSAIRVTAGRFRLPFTGDEPFP